MKKSYVALGLLVVLSLSGAWWYFPKNTGRVEPVLITNKEVSMPTVKEVASVAPKAPSSSHVVSDTTEGVRFSIPKEWTASKLPESGYSSFVSPGYSYAAMKLKGAFIGYRVWAPDADYTGTTEELIENWKSTHRDVSEITLNGATAYSSSYGNRTTIFAHIHGKFVDIEYGDETGEYKLVFNEFLKSFVVE